MIFLRGTLISWRFLSWESFLSSYCNQDHTISDTIWINFSITNSLVALLFSALLNLPRLLYMTPMGKAANTNPTLIQIGIYSQVPYYPHLNTTMLVYTGY